MFEGPWLKRAKRNPIMNAFNLIIIGDEILHGSRHKHFAFLNSLESHGLKSSIRCNICLTSPIRWSNNRAAVSDGLPTFVTGGGRFYA